MKKLLILTLLMLGLNAEAIAKPFIVNGRMTLLPELEGGCWYLEAENGEKYQIIGTPDQLRQIQVNGRMVKLRVEPEPRMASVCMTGRMVRILEILDVVGYPIDRAYVTVSTSGRIYKTKKGCWYLKTSQGHKYDLEFENIPKKKRKSGARVTNQHFRIFMDRSASECGFEGVASFIADPASKGNTRAKEKPKADPR